MITYQFPGCKMEHDQETGMTTTRYPDGASSACGVVPDDSYHAERLGITPIQHRLVHELGHHLVGIAYYKQDSSPVINADAHGKNPKEALKEAASLEEWMTTALTYHAFDRSADYGALVDLQGAGVDVRALSIELRALVDLAATGVKLVALHRLPDVPP